VLQWFSLLLAHGEEFVEENVLHVPKFVTTASRLEFFSFIPTDNEIWIDHFTPTLKATPMEWKHHISYKRSSEHYSLQGICWCHFGTRYSPFLPGVQSNFEYRLLLQIKCCGLPKEKVNLQHHSVCSHTVYILESFITHLTYILRQTTSTSSLDHWRSTLKENTSDVKMRQKPGCVGSKYPGIR
jgi:hypothetical protein